MKLNYPEILRNNMINVLKDVLLNIEKNGLKEGHLLYITFETNNPKVKIPEWLKDKYPNEMTIVMQHEYWDFNIYKKSFEIGLSFEDIKTKLWISFNSVVSFVDPFANFGLRLIPENKDKAINISKNTSTNLKKLNNKDKNKDNIINFSNFKKD